MSSEFIKSQTVSGEVKKRVRHPFTVDGLLPDSLIRVSQVLKIVSISKSSWWNGVKSGIYPAAIKLGPRTTVWRLRDVLALGDDR